nr:thiamine pyrophosphate-binding protein [Lachnospiraceae bacterium]
QAGCRIEADEKWMDYCNGLKKRFTAFEGAEGKSPDEAVSSYVFWKEFCGFEEDDSILALGNNTANSAKLQIGVKKRDQRVLANYTCGSMGYDLPAAEGAAMASGRKVYCITGDGCMMMNLQELQTIRHYDLPINIVVFNNDGYNAIRQTSKSFFEGKYIGCSPDTGVSFPEFKDIAKTFGFEYRLCRTNGELKKELEYLTCSDKRVMLEIIQAFDDPVVPKLMSRLDENGIMQTPVLQDMFPFIDRDEYEALNLFK